MEVDVAEIEVAVVDAGADVDEDSGGQGSVAGCRHWHTLRIRAFDQRPSAWGVPPWPFRKWQQNEGCRWAM